MRIYEFNKESITLPEHIISPPFCFCLILFLFLLLLFVFCFFYPSDSFSYIASKNDCWVVLYHVFFILGVNWNFLNCSHGMSVTFFFYIRPKRDCLIYHHLWNKWTILCTVKEIIYYFFFHFCAWVSINMSLVALFLEF